MAPLRLALAALLLLVAEGANVGASLQIDRAHVMAPAATAAEKSEAPPVKVEEAAGLRAKLRQGATWLGSFHVLRNVHESVAQAIHRHRSHGTAPTGPQVVMASGADGTEDLMATIITTIISMFLWLVLYLVVAYVYSQNFLSPPVDLEKAQEAFKDQGFTHGPFSCHEDMEILAWSCCCGGIRWADTMQSLGMLSFWMAVGLFMFTILADTFTGGAVMWIVLAVVFTYYRQEIRKKFTMKNDGEDQVKDFGMWCCCACCAIAQEARHFKLAPKMEGKEAAALHA